VKPNDANGRLPLADRPFRVLTSENQAEHMAGEDHVRASFEAPPHRIADWKLKWRELRLSAGLGPRGSSPAVQEQLGLNRDATFSPKSGEGEKLRHDT
jgi:hypothetical protein